MELNIIDTGYLNADKTGTQLSASARAGYDGTSSVNVLNLPNIISSTIGGKLNSNDSPQAGSQDITEVSINSFDNDKISISFNVSRSSLPAGTFDINYIHQIKRLYQTEGIKLLYPSGTGNFNTALMYLADYYTNGAMSTTFISTDIPYLPIIINDIKFIDKPTSKYINITMVATLTK